MCQYMFTFEFIRGCVVPPILFSISRLGMLDFHRTVKQKTLVFTGNIPTFSMLHLLYSISLIYEEEGA